MEKIEKLSNFQVIRDPFSAFLYTCGVKINYFTHFVDNDKCHLEHLIVNQFKIIAVEEGECVIDFATESPSITIKAGDICIIPPMALHSGKVTTTPFSNYEVFFEFAPISKEYELIHLIALAKPCLLSGALEEYPKSYLSKMHEGVFSEKNGSYINLLNFICQVLANRYYDLPEVETTQLNPREIQIFRAAYSYLEEHYHEAIAVADLCDALAISQSYLFRAISNIAHISPSAFIHKYKMIQAERMLKTTDASIEDIALDLGYSNIYYFSTTFKKAFGISPSNYRKSGIMLF